MMESIQLSATSKNVILLLACCVAALVSDSSATQKRLTSEAQYHKYIDPLLQVNDFGMYYYEDGAADASVLFPTKSGNPYGRPAAAVIALIRLRENGFPILIDCLSENRIANVRFTGNNLTREMRVPLGYVCLDILMQTTWGKPVADPECSDDGLGACMNYGYYFRPDDYSNCWDSECLLRPWVTVVQQNWRTQYLNHRLTFRNPYDLLRVDEYKDLRTPAN